MMNQQPADDDQHQTPDLPKPSEKNDNQTELDVDLKKRVDESARILQTYRHNFDLSVVNHNLDAAFETLHTAVDKLYTEPQWVPVSWVY